MMLKCKALPVFALLVWLFAIGHCIAEGVHTHTDPKAHQAAPHHHHHGHEHSHQHDLPQPLHHQDDDGGVPCEMLSLLPADAPLKLLRTVDLDDHPQLITNIDAASNDVLLMLPLQVLGLPPPRSYATDLMHRLMSLTVSHGPPAFAC
jgi:hypothetical protein